MPHRSKLPKHTPLKFALVYALIAGLWILLSDKLLVLLTASPEQALFLQTYKGGAFVLGTALLLYLLLRNGIKKLQNALRKEQELSRRLSLAMESASISYFIYTPHDATLILEEPVENNGQAPWRSHKTTLQAFVHPDDLDEVQKQLSEHLEASNDILHVEHRVRTGDNKWGWYMARGKQYTSNGQTIITGTLMDITERKSMERSLRKSQRELLAMADAIPDYIARFDTNLRHIFVNQAMCDVVGISRDHYLGKTNEDLGMPRELLETWTPPLQEVLSTGQERLVQFDFPVKGEQRHMEARLAPEIDDQGDVVGVIGVTRDITEFKKTHQALLASEKRLNDAQRIAHVASYERDLTTGKGFWSNELYRLLGYAPGERANSLELFLEHVHPDDRKAVHGIFQEAIARKSEFAGEFRYLRTNKQLRYGFLNGKITRDAQGNAVHYQGIFQDITERKRAAEEYALLATAIEQASEGVLITDASGVVHYVNPAFERASGYQRHEILGHTPRVLKSNRHDEDFYKTLWQTISNGQVWQGRFINRCKDGSLYEVDTTISPVRNSSGNITNFVALERDVTERTRLEQQLRQAQKMEAIGTLAGGVAHDFNNILAAIMGFAEIALLEAPKELESVRESLQDILSGSRRGSELVRNILTFSRQAAQDKIPLEIQPLVKEALKLMRASLPASIEIKEHLELKQGVIMADPSDMQQLLLNLCTNAGHAMGTDGGVLEVNLRPYDPQVEELLRHPNLSPGPHLLLRVTDNGPGMKPEIVERIFDPFFTTKAPGEGTGLGLSIVHGIVQSNGGAIEVESSPGAGTSITVLLPLSQQTLQNGRQDDSLMKGDQRILLVDDEEAVARSLERMLGLLGYEVSVAKNGLEALKLLQEEEERFDLLLTDQMMPGMNGLELAVEARRLQPHMPVLLSTGYGLQDVEQKAAQAGVHCILAKPIELRTLSAAMYEALNTKQDQQETPPGQEA